MSNNNTWLDQYFKRAALQANAGAVLPLRSKINFLGTVADNPSNDSTDITLGGGGGASAGRTNLTLSSGANNNVATDGSLLQVIGGLTGPATLTGIAPSVSLLAGQPMQLVNTTPYPLTIAHLDARSSSANQINCLSSSYVLGPYGRCSLHYDNVGGHFVLSGTATRQHFYTLRDFGGQPGWPQGANAAAIVAAMPALAAANLAAWNAMIAAIIANGHGDVYLDDTYYFSGPCSTGLANIRIFGRGWYSPGQTYCGDPYWDWRGWIDAGTPAFQGSCMVFINPGDGLQCPGYYRTPIFEDFAIVGAAYGRITTSSWTVPTASLNGNHAGNITLTGNAASGDVPSLATQLAALPVGTSVYIAGMSVPNYAANPPTDRLFGGRHNTVSSSGNNVTLDFQGDGFDAPAGSTVLAEVSGAGVMPLSRGLSFNAIAAIKAKVQHVGIYNFWIGFDIGPCEEATITDLHVVGCANGELVSGLVQALAANSAIAIAAGLSGVAATGTSFAQPAAGSTTSTIAFTFPSYSAFTDIGSVGNNVGLYSPTGQWLGSYFCTRLDATHATLQRYGLPYDNVTGTTIPVGSIVAAAVGPTDSTYTGHCDFQSCGYARSVMAADGQRYGDALYQSNLGTALRLYGSGITNVIFGLNHAESNGRVSNTGEAPLCWIELGSGNVNGVEFEHAKSELNAIFSVGSATNIAFVTATACQFGTVNITAGTQITLIGRGTGSGPTSLQRNGGGTFAASQVRSYGVAGPLGAATFADQFSDTLGIGSLRWYVSDTGVSRVSDDPLWGGNNRDGFANVGSASTWSSQNSVPVSARVLNTTTSLLGIGGGCQEWFCTQAGYTGYPSAVLRNSAVGVGGVIIGAQLHDTWQVTTAGTTGASEPAWPTNPGALTVDVSTLPDGTAVLTYRAPASLTAQWTAVGKLPGGSGPTVNVASGTVTLTPTQCAADVITATGTLTANATLAFPAYQNHYTLNLTGVTLGGFTLSASCPNLAGGTSTQAIAVRPVVTVLVDGAGHIAVG